MKPVLLLLCFATAVLLFENTRKFNFLTRPSSQGSFGDRRVANGSCVNSLGWSCSHGAMLRCGRGKIIVNVLVGI